MSESAVYRVSGEFRLSGTRPRKHTFRVVADSPEHADQRVRDFFDSEDGTVHEGIELESSESAPYRYRIQGRIPGTSPELWEDTEHGSHDYLKA